MEINLKNLLIAPEVGGNVLIQRGRVNHGDGNKNPSEGIITKGSQIVVPEGMAMMIVDNGAIADFSAEPGIYTYEQSNRTNSL